MACVNQGSLSEPDQSNRNRPPNSRYTWNVLSELLKIQKFGHLLIGMIGYMIVFIYSIFVQFWQFPILGFELVHCGSIIIIVCEHTYYFNTCTNIVYN